MQIENNKEEVPFSYYEGLFKNLNPNDVMDRLSDVKWDGKEFYVNLLGGQYAISHPEYAIRAIDGENPPDCPSGSHPPLGKGGIPPLPTQTFLLRYLLEGKSVMSTGAWLTFREMPWGELYIKPYTGRVLTRAAFTFGTRVEAFKKAAESMGAESVKHGDAGYQFNLIGGYSMQILVWAGDEEFPPNAQVLYSDNFADGFAAEDRVVAGDILISSIKANM